MHRSFLWTFPHVFTSTLSELTHQSIRDHWVCVCVWVCVCGDLMCTDTCLTSCVSMPLCESMWVCLCDNLIALSSILPTVLVCVCVCNHCVCLCKAKKLNLSYWQYSTKPQVLLCKKKNYWSVTFENFPWQLGLSLLLCMCVCLKNGHVCEWIYRCFHTGLVTLNQTLVDVLIWSYCWLPLASSIMLHKLHS